MLPPTPTPHPYPPPPPLAHPTRQETLEEQQEVLRAWHGWVLRELDHFKSKFRGAAATLLGAGDVRGFSLGAPLPLLPGWLAAWLHACLPGCCCRRCCCRRRLHCCWRAPVKATRSLIACTTLSPHHHHTYTRCRGGECVL